MNREAMILKGNIYLQTKKTEEAEQAFREAFKLDSTDS